MRIGLGLHEGRLDADSLHGEDLASDLPHCAAEGRDLPAIEVAQGHGHHALQLLVGGRRGGKAQGIGAHAGDGVGSLRRLDDAYEELLDDVAEGFHEVADQVRAANIPLRECLGPVSEVIVSGVIARMEEVVEVHDQPCMFAFEFAMILRRPVVLEERLFLRRDVVVEASLEHVVRAARRQRVHAEEIVLAVLEGVPAGEDGQVRLPDLVGHPHELVGGALACGVEGVARSVDLLELAEARPHVEEQHAIAQSPGVHLQEYLGDVLHVDVAEHSDVRLEHIEAAGCVDWRCMASMSWRVRGRLVSWANISVGIRSCPTPPRRPAVCPDPTRP